MIKINKQTYFGTEALSKTAFLLKKLIKLKTNFHNQNLRQFGPEFYEI